MTESCVIRPWPPQPRADFGLWQPLVAGFRLGTETGPGVHPHNRSHREHADVHQDQQLRKVSIAALDAPQAAPLEHHQPPSSGCLGAGRFDPVPRDPHRGDALHVRVGQGIHIHRAVGNGVDKGCLSISDQLGVPLAVENRTRHRTIRAETRRSPCVVSRCGTVGPAATAETANKLSDCSGAIVSMGQVLRLFTRGPWADSAPPRS